MDELSDAIGTASAQAVGTGGGRARGEQSRAWTAWALSVVNDADHGPVDPPLITLPCPELPGIHIYLKDETAHATGSLKHRLAHALFLHGLCNGDIGEDTIVIEASSGSTAISEAWFAAKLGLRFIAVVPARTASAKLAAIGQWGADVVFAEEGENVVRLASAVAAKTGGHFMNQFANAAIATDWRGANSLADTLFAQMRETQCPIPAWVVAGAGTGGTSTTIGRFVRLRAELAAKQP